MSDGTADNFLDSFIEDYFAESEDHLHCRPARSPGARSTIGVSEPPSPP